jgi:hypothetical protein
MIRPRPECPMPTIDQVRGRLLFGFSFLVGSIFSRRVRR